MTKIKTPQTEQARPGMERHNSCVNTRAIITYVEQRHGSAQELLAGLDELLVGVADPIEFLKDINNWVSSEVVGRLFANARLVTGDPNVARKIGFESVTQKKLGYIQHIFLRALGSPRGTLKHLKAINDKFNLNKEIDLEYLGWDQAIVRLRWRDDLELSRDFCLMNQGVYSALPTMWGLPAAQVKETRCQFHGSEFCEFELHWKNPSVWQRLHGLGLGRKRLLADTLAELDRDKRLLHQKFSEITALNLSLQHKIDQLISIQQASGAILSELEYRKLYPTVLKLFVRAIGYNRGMIMLLDQETQTLRYTEGVGASAQDLKVLEGYTISLTHRHNLLVQVANSGQPMLCEDTSVLNLNPNNPIIRKWKPKSIVVLPLVAQGRVIGLLAADRQDESRAMPNLDRDYLQVFANQVALALENARMYRNLQDSFLSTVQALALALEAKDTYTRGHSERVTQYAIRLGERLSLPEAALEQIRRVSVLHDIGKIGVDRSILNKAGALAEHERAVIHQHPSLGQTIIAPLNLSREEMAIIRHHHERHDGQGYPDGLSGEELPIQVRVVTVADAFDAMTSDRPYRQALDLRQALAQLEAGAGTQFDPIVVAAFVSLVHQGGFRDLLLRSSHPAPMSKRSAA